MGCDTSEEGGRTDDPLCIRSPRTKIDGLTLHSARNDLVMCARGKAYKPTQVSQPSPTLSARLTSYSQGSVSVEILRQVTPFMLSIAPLEDGESSWCRNPSALSASAGCL